MQSLFFHSKGTENKTVHKILHQNIEYYEQETLPTTPLPTHFMGKITINCTQALSNSGISIKIEVASRFE